MNDTIQLLQQYGGWATTAFCGLGIIKLYLDNKKTVAEKDKLINELNKTHHEEMVAVVRECTGVLTTVNDSLDRWEQRMDRRDGQR